MQLPRYPGRRGIPGRDERACGSLSCARSYESKAVLSEIYAGDRAELELDTFFQDNGTNTETCLLRAKSGDKLVLAFRGTQEAMDWWTDGKNLAFDSFEGSSVEKVGYGFYQAVLTLPKGVTVAQLDSARIERVRHETRYIPFNGSYKNCVSSPTESASTSIPASTRF